MRILFKKGLKKMNWHIVQKKEKNYHIKNMTKIEQIYTKRGKQHSPKSATPANIDKSEAEFSNETSPIEKEEGLNNRKDQKNGK